MVADAGLIGLSLLPFLFFYCSNSLSQTSFKMFSSIMFFLGLISAYSFVMVMEQEMPDYSMVFVGMGYGIITVFLFGIVIEFFTLIATAFANMKASGERL